MFKLHGIGKWSNEWQERRKKQLRNSRPVYSFIPGGAGLQVSYTTQVTTSEPIIHHTTNLGDLYFSYLNLNLINI